MIIGTVVSPLGRIGQSILSVRWMLYAVVCAEEAAGGTPGCVAAPVGGATPEEPEDIPAGTSMKCAGVLPKPGRR